MIKASSSIQNLKRSLINEGQSRMSSVLLPLIFTQNCNAIDEKGSMKLSLPSIKDELPSQSIKNRQTTTKLGINHQHKLSATRLSKDSIHPQSQHPIVYQDTLVSGPHIQSSLHCNHRNSQQPFLITTIESTLEGNELSLSPLNRSLDNKRRKQDRSFTQEKLQLKVFKKAKRYMSQDNSLIRGSTIEDNRTLPYVQSLQLINKKMDKQNEDCLIQASHAALSHKNPKNHINRQYLQLINSKRIRLSKQKFNQALMRRNEKRIKDRYNGQSANMLTQEDKADLITSCLIINQTHDKDDQKIHGLNHSQSLLQIKVMPSAENLMKQLNL